MSVEIATKEDFQQLRKELGEVRALIQLYADSNCLPKIVRVKDVAKMENVSSRQLYQTEAYLLPRFGQSAFPAGSIRWPLEEYLSWRSIDPKKRIEMWHEHLEAERKRFVAESKSKR